MRFEIGPGGMFLILLGLAGLSAAVFGLGLVAGHEMAGPEQGSQPVAAAYPLPAAAPANAPSESAEGSEPATEAGSSSETAGATAAVNPPSKSAEAAAPAVKAAAPAAVAGAGRKTTVSTKVASRSTRTNAASTETDEDLSTGTAVAPPSESASAPAETANTGEDEGEEEAAPAPAPVAPPRRRLAAVTPPAPRTATGPYSVQIDAMMDQAGAQQMAQKIRAKGFEPYIIPTTVDGKVWYRLRVGHYATPEEAQAAESRLHQEFNDNSGN